MIVAQLKYFKCLCIFRIDKRLSQRFSGLAIESYERYQAVLLWCERMKRQQNIYIKSQRLDFAFHTLSIVQSAEFEVCHLFFFIFKTFVRHNLHYYLVYMHVKAEKHQMKFSGRKQRSVFQVHFSHFAMSYS